MLSDPQRRQAYDQYGEEGLSGSGGSQNGFNPRNAEDIFAEFFGSSPFGFGSGGIGRSTRYSSNGDCTFRNGDHDGNGVMKKPPPAESALPCTLEELYSGSTRKMKISRQVVDSNG